MCFGKMKEIDDSMPSKRYAKLVAELPRKKASLIMQLRSGHIPLQAHLFRIAWAEAPDCPRCCARKETVHHFLIESWYALLTWHRDRGWRMGTLVIVKLLSSMKPLEHLFNYVPMTK
jgi:hypothetical protein